ncbi:unnamed protein product [Fraxinus pennsylvanica]|uniref:G protein gamma domain-containing protein n=1 Tax=Fraxinus pennsylvanica TaxID=56036 RepID=A0AAD2A8F1_9LAMI|nr:unnamed protein product [Fraxinus pennsylvanica]
MNGSGGDGSWPLPLPLPPPRPKSPPEYPDLYGKRRGLVNVQMMEREIGYLEEELKSVESLQPASRACKEVVDLVSGNTDPLIPVTRKTRRSCNLSCGFWKWLWYMLLNTQLCLMYYIFLLKISVSSNA